MTETEPASAPATGSDDELDHLFCCDENRACCGADLTDVPLIEESDGLLCVVCEDLDDFVCEVSGCTN